MPKGHRDFEGGTLSELRTLGDDAVYQRIAADLASGDNQTSSLHTTPADKITLVTELMVGGDNSGHAFIEIDSADRQVMIWNGQDSKHLFLRTPLRMTAGQVLKVTWVNDGADSDRFYAAFGGIELDA